MGKDLEGSGRGLVEVLSRHLSEGTEEYHDKYQARQCPAEIGTRHVPNITLELRL
jgi:hypothetical protein